MLQIQSSFGCMYQNDASIPPSLVLSETIGQNKNYFNVAQSQFLKIAEFFSKRAIPEVEMGETRVVTGPMIGTHGVSACHVICVRGETPEGLKVLGMSHHCLEKPCVSLEKLKVCLLKYGCGSESIEFFIIGGMPDSLLKEDEDEELDSEAEDLASIDRSSNDSDTSTQKEFKSLADRYNIKEIKFNVVEKSASIQSIDVILTPHRILYGENLIFFDE